jgi:hypothetical protein
VELRGKKYDYTWLYVIPSAYIKLIVHWSITYRARKWTEIHGKRCFPTQNRRILGVYSAHSPRIGLMVRVSSTEAPRKLRRYTAYLRLTTVELPWTISLPSVQESGSWQTGGKTTYDGVRWLKSSASSAYIPRKRTLCPAEVSRKRYAIEILNSSKQKSRLPAHTFLPPDADWWNTQSPQ